MIETLVPARELDLGGIPVRRLLPVAKHRSVGPFVFLDHMGPVRFSPGTGMDVGPHPHIGLATLTYLYAGELCHRDSLGVVQEIRPGDVNLMTAGRGIAHSERSTEAGRARGDQLHGLQFWLAQEPEHEDDDPTFVHAGGGTLPTFAADAAHGRVVIGSFEGLASPVRFTRDARLVDLAIEQEGELSLELPPGEHGLYVASGAVELDETPLPSHTLALLPASSRVRLRVGRTPARVALFGGQPLGAPRRMWWNFVATDDARIARAKRDWAEGRFAKVADDDEPPMPLPPG